VLPQLARSEQRATIGLARVTTRIGLANPVYNMRRLL
jgi:arginine/ornithine N-succinyltransferase beta subunit